MTALQPLTDNQVANRLDAYNAGGKLERDIRALWEDAGDIIESEVRDQFGDEAAAIVGRDDLGRLEMPARERRLAGTGGADQYDEGKLGETHFHAAYPQTAAALKSPSCVGGPSASSSSPTARYSTV